MSEPKFKKRSFVLDKGCLDLFGRTICVDLGECMNKETGKRRFYCVRSFPDDCSEFGCPKMMALDSKWLKELSVVRLYE